MEDSAESSSNPISQGCGQHSQISIQISPTTGGDFSLTVEPNITVENLKKLVSKKLKLPRDRICLLFRDKQLQEGIVTQHGVSDGSKVTLLPNVETGLVTQRPEIGIMQALESLNDTQVNEFLCGKAPLNLSMRFGDHMMLIQLQLSTVSGTKPPPSNTGGPPPSRPPSLMQASRNLQHTLRRLSADVFSGRDEVIDSSSKLQSGILIGNLVEFGSFKQCVNIEAATRSGVIRGRQCILRISPPLSILQKILSFRGISAKRFDKLKSVVQDAGVYWSVCVPDSCTYRDVLQHFRKNIILLAEGLDIDVTLDELDCFSMKEAPKLTTTQYVALSIILGIVGINVLCGLIDIFSNEKSKMKNSAFVDIFSSYRNAKYILVYRAGDSHGLRCLDGIRFLSISYVVIGHSFLMMLFAPSVNSLELMEWLLEYSSTIIIGGTVCVDSFFMLSGILVTYHTLDLLSLKNGRINWFFFVVYRFVRLTPPYAIVILVYSTLLQFTGSGPMWRKVVLSLQKPCEKFWWSAILNIQNYMNPKSLCIVQSWYMTDDFLYYMLSPLLIYSLWKWKILGWINLFIVYIVSVMINFFLAWINKYGAGMMVSNQLLYTDFFAYHYIAPHVRASTYILGMVLGGILHKTKNVKIKLHPVTVTVGWMWSLVLILATILGNHPFQLENHDYNRLEASFYLALSRSSWTIGLMWIVWACKHSYGGPVNSFLSNPVFQVLAKLSYSIFLWHLVLQFLLVGALKQPTYFSDFNMVYRFLGEFAMVITFSFFCTILFECPCIRFLSYLKHSRRKIVNTI